MALTKITAASVQEIEAVFVKEIPQPVTRQQFTIKQLDAQIEHLQAQIDQLKADKAEALEIIALEKLNMEESING